MKIENEAITRAECGEITGFIAPEKSLIISIYRYYCDIRKLAQALIAYRTIITSTISMIFFSFILV